MTIKIAPSILAADFGRLAAEVEALDAAGCDYIHVDVMDGRFVPNITIGQPVVRALSRVTKKPLDVHLMIEEPEQHVDSFIEAGAGLVTFHVEACRHVHRLLQRIRAAGARAGLAINPGTPLEAIRWVLEDVDLVLVMSVNPGFGGQSFIPGTLKKLRELRKILDQEKLSCEVEVDGGVVVDNIAGVHAAGADVFVSGTGILGAEDYATRIKEMRARCRA